MPHEDIDSDVASALEASAPSKVGNWVIGLSGALVWDPWDFPEPSEEEGVAAHDRIVRQMEQIAAKLRAQPDYKPPTEAQKAEATRRLDEALERMHAEKRAVREFTAKIERERAERAAADTCFGEAHAPGFASELADLDAGQQAGG